MQTNDPGLVILVKIELEEIKLPILYQAYVTLGVSDEAVISIDASAQSIFRPFMVRFGSGSVGV